MDVECECHMMHLSKLLPSYIRNGEHLLFLFKSCFNKFRILIPVLFSHFTKGCCVRVHL